MRTTRTSEQSSFLKDQALLTYHVKMPKDGSTINMFVLVWQVKPPWSHIAHNNNTTPENEPLEPKSHEGLVQMTLPSQNIGGFQVPFVVKFSVYCPQIRPFSQNRLFLASSRHAAPWNSDNLWNPYCWWRIQNRNNRFSSKVVAGTESQWTPDQVSCDPVGPVGQISWTVGWVAWVGVVLPFF